MLSYCRINSEKYPLNKCLSFLTQEIWLHNLHIEVDSVFIMLTRVNIYWTLSLPNPAFRPWVSFSPFNNSVMSTDSSPR